VRTGLDDDRRRPLDRDHPHYRQALYALAWQDRWSDEQHRDYWTALVAAWPRERGQRQLREAMGWAAHELRRYGLDDAAIADVLAVDVDTIRRRDLHGAGEMVWHEQIEQPAIRFARHGPQPPLPRVWTDGDELPAFSWVNLPLAALQRPREVVAIEVRLHRKLDELRETA